MHDETLYLKSPDDGRAVFVLPSKRRAVPLPFTDTIAPNPPRGLECAI